MYTRSFFDELTKIGEKQEDTLKNVGTGVASGLVGTIGASYPTGVISKAVSNAAMEGMLGESTLDEARKLGDHLSPGTAIDYRGNITGPNFRPSWMPQDPTLAEAASPKNPGSFYDRVFGDDARKNTHLPQNAKLKGVAASATHFRPESIAHELGHARLHNKSKLLSKALLAARLGGMASPLIGTVAAASADPDSAASKYAPLAAGLSTVPTLADEAYASIKGYGAMKRLGYGKEALKGARGSLGKAFGSYLAAMTLPAVLAPYLTRKTKQYLTADAKSEPSKLAAVAGKRLSKIAEEASRYSVTPDSWGAGQRGLMRASARPGSTFLADPELVKARSTQGALGGLLGLGTGAVSGATLGAIIGGTGRSMKTNALRVGVGGSLLGVLLGMDNADTDFYAKRGVQTSGLLNMGRGRFTPEAAEKYLRD